jgi:hypothetical protein
VRQGIVELDDRREIWRLLAKLTPARRLRFLAWACRQVRGPLPVRVNEATHTGTANEAYADLMALEVMYRLDLAAAAARLERLVRKGE